MPPPQRSYSTAALLLCAASAAADVVLDGGAGLKWLVMSAGPSTYALGQPFLNRQPLDNAPVDDGIAFWRRMSDELVIPVLASSITVDASGAAATLSGSATLPSGGPGGGATDTAVAVRVALDGAFTAATLSVSFSSEAGVAKNEWQLCVKWAHDGESADEWRAQGYPIAANASRVDNARLEYVTLRHLKMRLDSPSLRPPPPHPQPPTPSPNLPSPTTTTTTTSYMGWPGLLLFRPNASVVAWFGVSALEDFSNPNTWTGATAFTFSSENGYLVAPQFWLGAGGLDPGQVCELSLRLVVSSAGETLAAVREIVPQLARLDAYAVEPMPPIREPADMLACFVNARRVTPMWQRTPNGDAYQLHVHWAKPHSAAYRTTTTAHRLCPPPTAFANNCPCTPQTHTYCMSSPATRAARTLPPSFTSARRLRARTSSMASS